MTEADSAGSRTLDGLRPSRRPEAQWRAVGGEILILHSLLKQYHVLNATAARIWELADGSRTPAEIAEALAEEFAHDREAVQRDVVETLEGLQALQLLDLRGERGGPEEG